MAPKIVGTCKCLFHSRRFYTEVGYSLTIISPSDNRGDGDSAMEDVEWTGQSHGCQEPSMSSAPYRHTPGVDEVQGVAQISGDMATLTCECDG